MLSWANLPTNPDDCNDPKVYAAISTGRRQGVFQLDSTLGKRTLRKVRPRNFSELCDILALVRPGAMDHIDAYVNQQGPAQPHWRFHEELKTLDEILQPTHFVLLYQEQVLQALNIVCGWDYGDADLVLSALRKKKLDKLEEAKPKYLADGKYNGYSEEALEALWEILLPFANYSFAKAHAAAYAVISYWTGWFMVNHPNAYYAALFTALSDNQEKLTAAIVDAKENGVALLPPDINESNLGFTPTSDGIRFGLGAIKGVGPAVIESIKEMTIGSLDEFYAEIPNAVNARSLQCLIKAGTFDYFGNRVDHAERSQDFIDRAKEVKKAVEHGDQPLIKGGYRISKGRSGLKDMQAWEMELLGTELSKARIGVEVTRDLSEMEWVWVNSVLAGSPGSERVTFTLKGATFTSCQTVSGPDRISTMLVALDGLKVELS